MNLCSLQAQFKLITNFFFFLVTGGYNCVRHRIQLWFSLLAEQCYLQVWAPCGSVQACFSPQHGASNSGCCGLHPCPWSHHASSWNAGPLGHTCLQRWGYMSSLSTAISLDTCQASVKLFTSVCLVSFAPQDIKSFPQTRPWSRLLRRTPVTSQKSKTPNIHLPH